MSIKVYADLEVDDTIEVFSLYKPAKGFVSGGVLSGSTTEVTSIETFHLEAEIISTSHGDLEVATKSHAGHSSTTMGYTSGGWNGANLSEIQKFDFSTNVTSRDHGDLLGTNSSLTGTQSPTQGFSLGGAHAGGSQTNIIQRFDFSSNVTASALSPILSSLVPVFCLLKTTSFAACEQNTTSPVCKDELRLPPDSLLPSRAIKTSAALDEGTDSK